jgi:hypothetical protein
MATTTSKTKPSTSRSKSAAHKPTAKIADAKASGSPFGFELPDFEVPKQLQELAARLPQFELRYFQLPKQLQELAAKLPNFELPDFALPNFEVPKQLQELTTRLSNFELPYVALKADS